MRIAFVTDFPFCKDIRGQRTIDVLARGHELFVIDQGLLVDESRYILGEKGVLYPLFVPKNKIKKTVWHITNRLCPLHAYHKRTQQIYMQLMEISPDIIHCVNIFGLEASLKASRDLGAKLVYEAYEFWPEYILADNPRIPPRLGMYLKKIEEGAAHAAPLAAFITVSDPIAQWYTETIGTPKAHVIYNSNVPGASFCQDQEEARCFVKNREKEAIELRLLYSGNLMKERNISVAVDALAQLKDHPNITLTIQGEGVELEKLKGRVDYYGLSSQIKFVPYVAPECLISSLQSFDVGLHIVTPGTKQMDGATPNKLFDYMRAGLAIISTDTLGIRLIKGSTDFVEFIPNPDANILATAILKLYMDVELLKQMKTKSRERSTLYSRSLQEKTLSDLYDLLAIRTKP